MESDKVKKCKSCRRFGRSHLWISTVFIGLVYLFMCLSALAALARRYLKGEMNIFIEEPMFELDLLDIFGNDTFDDLLMGKRLLNNDGVMKSTLQNSVIEIFIIGFLLISTIFLIVLMIYGAIRRIAWCLLPFLFWQLLDLILTPTSLIVLYFWIIESIEKRDVEMDAQTIISTLLDIKYDQYCIVLGIIFVCVISLKIYALSIVYRCSQYFKTTSISLMSAVSNEHLEPVMNESTTNISRNSSVLIN